MEIGEIELLTLKQASERIGVSPNTLAIQAKKGALKAVKMGRSYLITADELARYDAQRKAPRGFASPDHPLHGKRGGGGRRKKDDPIPR
jgi:excisionase family DNA binding protein